MNATTDIDRELVATLVSSLRQCEADGWKADMGNYGFVIGYNRDITPTGGKCCFMGAEMLLNHRGYRSPARDEASAICGALGLSRDFVLGFNCAVIWKEEGRQKPLYPNQERQRGQDHGNAAWRMWKGE